MQEVNVACNQLMYGFVDNYMEKIFYFGLKKTGNSTEAEDLTQDIALNVFSALRKGVIPHAFSAWVWQIARNRYATWAREKHDRRESVSGSDIWNCEVEDETYSIADEMTHAEQMALLRRELAFIKSDYRNIVVAYYIENKSIREIAGVVSLSECAIQQRLHRARKRLKEGMDMAREFGIGSYRPEEVSFVKNGRNGEKGQPWTIVSHLLYKNIFLEVYENPETAEEIAIALGIALHEGRVEFSLVRTAFAKGRKQILYKLLHSQPGATAQNI